MNEEIEERVGRFIDVIMKVGNGDYSVQLELSENYDYLDALAMGINMMVDDLRKSRETELENDRISQLNAQLIEAKKKAEESDRLKSAFLANMSHEIRTPMNGILGFAELLKEPELTGEQQQEYISIIEKGGERMLSIINDIIDISKIEADLMKTTISKTNINEQTQFVYKLFKPEAEGKGLQIFIKNSLPENEAITQTDHEKLYAILINLVKNAIKYTKEGSIEFGYHVKEDAETAKLEFYVKDTGTGIAEDRQHAIFERFVQADIDDKSALHGAGLGLAISKAYVDMLGGNIWVESEKDKGSIFYFNIPYITGPTEKPVAETENNAETNDNKNLKVLVVEDDDASEKLVSIIAKGFSKEILNAATGAEAVEICRNNPDIDLVLMDIKLPVMDGYEATRQIRRFNTDVVIIAQTAYGLTGDREKTMEAGCNDYISKPILKKELLALIQKYF